MILIFIWYFLKKILRWTSSPQTAHFTCLKTLGTPCSSIDLLLNTFPFQIALNNGHEKGTRAAYVGIHRAQEDAQKFNTPITAFKVKPGETWVLFSSVGQDIHHGKTKRKLFSRRQEKWVDKDGQDRDPHACLKKGRLSKRMSCQHLFHKYLDKLTLRPKMFEQLVI